MTAITAKLPDHRIAYTGFNHKLAKATQKQARKTGLRTNLVQQPVLGSKTLKHFTLWTYPQ